MPLTRTHTVEPPGPPPDDVTRATDNEHPQTLRANIDTDAEPALQIYHHCALT
ncbi:hypothetical protein Pa4123_68950 [Phytohabitans aurantiacus]|uniref:Uncharacterized protein n=1 Tax=Phytohabitans aurantiacus TaxID=3016789 RepID=A0ABQ5R4B3_9ACTN|nr:hypothetical protein Pa4123_68950 [Phytohabitans aurantiacus]